ncbi:MAG: SurA N-terminal domain-containing protein [Elusimicrobia bacterium]|nr:SurA N-terminal domain-containing protein [Candidatus Liberimonas magnetica]
MIMNFLRKHRTTIFAITILGFLSGAFVGFGSYFFGRKTASDAVAEVNGVQIPYTTYYNLYNRVVENMRKKNTEVTDDILKTKKQEVVQDLIQEEVFYQESLKYGIKVSDGEIAADINSYPGFQKNGQFDRFAYYNVLNQILRTTPQKFEESRKRQIAVFKLRYLIASSVRLTEPEIRLEYMRANRGDMSKFEAQRQEFIKNLRQEKVAMVFNEWFKQLNISVKIKVHLNEIEKGQS